MAMVSLMMYYGYSNQQWNGIINTGRLAVFFSKIVSRQLYMTTLMLQYTLKCYPDMLKIKKYDKVRKNITAHALLHAKEVEIISEEFKISFGDTSQTFEAELQLAEKVVMNYSCEKCDSPQNTTSSEDILQAVSSSSVPNMLKMLGPYENRVFNDFYSGQIYKDHIP